MQAMFTAGLMKLLDFAVELLSIFYFDGQFGDGLILLVVLQLFLRRLFV